MELSQGVPDQKRTGRMATWGLREGAQRGGGQKAQAPRPQSAPPEREESDLVCLACRHPITSCRARMDVAGVHRHTFANPHGFVYCIGCFSCAPGCLPVGRSSMEFPWFVGFSWQVAVCGRCGVHLGWSFRSADRSFHGLILDRLLDQEAGQRHDSR